MISQVNSSAIRNAYGSSLGNANEIKQVKESEDVKSAVVTKQGDKSRVDEIKDALKDGSYKVDLNALSELIADELL